MRGDLVTRHPRIIVVDTETTGVQPFDRLVSLAAIRIENGEINLNRALHLLFDPRKDSHPQAAAVHGFDDWTLRHQDLFASLAPGIRLWLGWADLLVMHNAAFDMRYLAREIRKAGQPPLTAPTFCTMTWARENAMPQRLDACASRLIGVDRTGEHHSALQDALLTAAILLNIEGRSCRLPDLAMLPGLPKNYRTPPPRPDGELPRRAAKRPVAWPPPKA